MALLDNIKFKFLFKIPEEYQHDFRNELIAINIFRAKVVAFIVMLLNIILGLIPDYYFYSRGYWTINQGYEYWTLMHGLFALFSLLCFFVFNHLDQPEKIEHTKFHNALLHIFAACFIILCGGITIVDQMMGNTVTVYIMGLVIIATLFYFPFWTDVILFFSTMIAMFLLLPIFQQDPMTLFSHYITISEMVVGMWLVSLILYSMKSQNFYNSKTIENQKEFIQSKIEELHRANIKLMISNNRLSKLDEEKNDLLDMAAHDLKTPLSGISGISDLMIEKPVMDPPKIKHYAQLIFDASNRMITLIENFLNINSIERGNLQFNFKNWNLSDTVNKVISNNQNLADKKAIPILTEIDKNIPAVYADEYACYQIVDNLLTNAIKFSPKESNIKVKLYSKDGLVTVVIQDNGPGISEEDQKLLFRKFTTLSAKPTAGEHSSGLGLSIVKRMADSMNASVICESEVDHGTTFKVTFPTVELIQG